MLENPTRNARNSNKLGQPIPLLGSHRVFVRIRDRPLG